MEKTEIPGSNIGVGETDLLTKIGALTIESNLWQTRYNVLAQEYAKVAAEREEYKAALEAAREELANRNKDVKGKGK